MRGRGRGRGVASRREIPTSLARNSANKSLRDLVAMNTTTGSKKRKVGDSDDDSDSSKRQRQEDDDDVPLLQIMQESNEDDEDIDKSGDPGGSPGEQKQKTSKKQRDLKPIRERGLGPNCAGVETRGGIRDHGLLELPADKEVTAWWFRDYVDLTYAPYGNTDTLRMLEDKSLMKEMAYRFYKPAYEDTPMRVLDSDIPLPNGQVALDDFGLRGKAIMTLANTLQKCPVFFHSTEDDMSAGILPQNIGARPEQIVLHNGYSGGLEGHTVIVGWELQLNPLNFGQPSEDMLEMASVLSMALSHPDINMLIPAISSDMTEVVPRDKICNSMRLKHENDKSALFQKYPWPLSQDLDQELLDRIISFRQQHNLAPHECSPDHQKIIPKRARINNPDLRDRHLSDQERQFSSCMIDGSLFSLQLYMTVYTCVDEDGRTQHIQLTALRMTGLPYACPLTALSQLKNEGGQLGTDFTRPLHAITVKMLEHLQIEQQGFNINDYLTLNKGPISASKVMGEEEMFLGIFMFAHQNKLLNVHVDKRRLDVTDEYEMALYHRLCANIQHAREGHWRMVQEAVFHHTSMQGSLKNIQNSHDKIPLDRNGEQIYGEFTGFYFSGVSLDIVKQRVDARVRANGSLALSTSNVQSCLSMTMPSEEDLDNKNSSWFMAERRQVEKEVGLWEAENPQVKLPRIYVQEEMVYIPVGCSVMSYNSGWLGTINQGVRKAYTRKVNKSKEDISNLADNLLEGPTKTSLAAKLLFDQDLKVDDLWTDPDLVLDESYMQQNEYALPPFMHKIYTRIREMREEVQIKQEKRTKHAMEDRKMFTLAGLTGPHPIHKIADDGPKKGDLSSMVSRQHHSMLDEIHKTIVKAHEGPLVQWKNSFHLLMELRRPEPPGSSNFLDFYSNWTLFQQHVKKQTAPDVGLMNIEAMSHKMNHWFLQRQNFDISFGNQRIIQIIQNALIMTFYGLKTGVCGVIPHIYDCAGSVSIDNVTRNGQTRINYLTKTPGCGADFSAATTAMLNLGFPAYTTRSKTVLAFFNSPDSQDKLMVHITDMRLHCLLGSGVMSQPGGGTDPNDNTAKLNLGLCTGLMELLKGKNKTKEGGDNTLKIIETRTDQPTMGQNALATDSYDSSSGMLQKKPIITNKVVPIFCITTNIAHKDVPESTLNGCRAIFIPSASPDTCGIIRRHMSGRGDYDPPESLPDTQANEMQDDDKPGDKEEEFVGLGLNFQNMEMMTTMKGVSQRMVDSDLIGYWILFKLRRLVAYMGKTMQAGYISRFGSYYSTLSGMEHQVRGLTRGLCRGNVTDGNVFFRNFMAAMRTVFVPGMHLTSLAWCSVMLRCDIPNMDTNGKTPMVDVGGGYDDMMMAVLHVPPSFTTMLSAVYLWLSMTMLDIQLVALSTFMLYTMGLQHNCPLQVLALAANGYDLTEEQTRRFNDLADWFIDACCEKKGDNTLLTRGQIMPLDENGNTLRMLESLFGTERDEKVTEMQKLQASRSKMVEPSAYMRAKFKPCLLITQYPSWADFSVQSANVNRKDRKLNLSGHDAVIAQLFADEMQADRAAQRTAASPSEKTQHKVELFWKAAQAGMRLPDTPKHKSDRETLDFKSVWLTGSWYQEIVDFTKKEQCGATCNFLKLCGLSTSHSLNQIFTKIFERRLQGRKFPESKAWMAPVYMDNKTVSKKFEWGNALTSFNCPRPPHEKRLGFEVMLGGHALWMLVAQGLYCNEWTKPHADGKCTAIVHTRVVDQSTLVLLFMYIHLLVEKSAIPANNGSISLRGSSPYVKEMKRKNACIAFDSRLHMEKHDIFSDQSRTLGNMEITQLSNGTKAMVFNHQVIGNQNSWQANAMFEIAAVPCESYAHFLSHWKRYQEATEHWWKTQEVQKYGPDCYLPLILEEFHKSMHIEHEQRGVECMNTYMAITPTFCTTQVGFEMPFVSSRYNFVFVLEVVPQGHISIRSVKMTNYTFTGAYQSLPLVGTKRSYQFKDFAFATRGGLKLLEDGGVICRQPEDIVGGNVIEPEVFDKSKWEILAMSPYPIFGWPHLVKLCVTSQRLLLSDPHSRATRHMTMLPVDVVFERDMEDDTLDQFTTRQFLLHNPDIPFTPDDNETLHVVRRNVASDFGISWMLIDEDIVSELNLEEIQHEDLCLYLKDITKKTEVTIDKDVWSVLLQSMDQWLMQNLQQYHFIRVTPDDDEDNTMLWMPMIQPDPRFNFWYSYTSGGQTYHVYFNSREHFKHAVCTDNMQTLGHDEYREYLLQPNSLHGSLKAQFYTFIPIAQDCTVTECEYSDALFYSKKNELILTKVKLNTISHRLDAFRQKENFADRTALEVAIRMNEAKANQLQTTIASLQQEIADLLPTPTVLSTWQVRPQADLSWNISPCSPSDTPRDTHIGVLKRHPENDKFLYRGQYLIAFIYNSQEFLYKMDFINTAYLCLQEGRNIYINLNSQRYRELLNSIPDAYLPDSEQHHALLEDKHNVFLRGYYVINHEETKHMHDVRVLALIEIHEKESPDEDEYQFDNRVSQKRILSVALFDDMDTQVIETDPPDVDENGNESFSLSVDTDDGDGAACVVVDHLIRNTYSSNCPYGPHKHSKSKPSDSICVRK